MSRRRFRTFALVVPLIFLVGCLSDGKFYEFSTQPHQDYPDVDRGNGEFTDGTKLTDGAGVGSPWTWTPQNIDKFVGWWNQTLDITVDLGASFNLSEINLHAGTYTPYAIQYPASVAVYHSPTNPTAPLFYANMPAFPADCSPPSCPELQSTAVQLKMNSSGPLTTRYVRYRITPKPGQFIFIDETMIHGAIPATLPNNVKYAPAPNGNPSNLVYHGAFAYGAGGSGPGVSNFESSAVANKGIASFLWYDSWDSPYGATQSLIDTYLGPTRALQLGWEPQGFAVCGCAPGVDCGCEALNEIYADLGTFDAYVGSWFAAAAAHGHPIFLRFASEMNGDWTPWSGPKNGGNGAAVARYRALWRRVYNIAQVKGATNVAFVWSPNPVSYPSSAYNEFRNYYPGDQYVDWVGTSLYTDGGAIGPILRPVYDAYVAKKPLMISETAACPAYKNPFITSLFDELEANFPAIWAVHWFNVNKECDWRIEATAQTRTNYQTRIGAARYLTQIQGN